MATITGTSNNDSINGGPQDDLIEGYSGNDTMYGGQGNDTLGGGPGNDFLVGGSGQDAIDGGDGSDVALFDDGTNGVVIDLRIGVVNDDGFGNTEAIVNVENLHGSSHNDIIQLKDVSTYVFGRAGNDVLNGGNSGMSFIAGSGNDTINGGTGQGDTAIYSYDGYDSAGAPTQGVVLNLTTGTATDNWGGTDTLSGVENLEGSQLDDIITGSVAGNRLEGGAGNDTLEGLAGNDTLNGGVANDKLDGGAGNDTLDGGAGNDSLQGGQGQDLLYGGAGDDVIDGGVILDRINYSDVNVASYNYATAGVNINLSGMTGDGSTGSGTATGDVSVGTDVLINISFIQGSNFDDTITGGTASIFDRIEGGAGNDTLDGGTISSSSGNRVVYNTTTGAGVTVDFLAGTSKGAPGSNAGNDTLINFAQVAGSRFDDTLLGSNRTDFSEGLEGAGGDDYIDGRGGFDYARYNGATGGVTANLMTGTSTGANVGTDALINIEGLLGSTFNDILTGDSVANRLEGSGGEDTLIGGAGNDTIDGGTGIDRAAFSGNLAGFTLSKAGTTYTVRSNTGTDGTDTLTNVESLQFADKTINLTIQAKAAAAPQAEVIRLTELYVAFFNRVPDADGLAYWIEQKSAGQSISQIADVFYSAGVQYSNLTGFSSSMSNGDFVNVIYRNVLGRSDGADAEGLAYWSGQLATGEATRGSLVSSILDSAHSFKGNATYGFVADLLDNKYAVAKTFAIDWGLNYNTASDSITQGMAIAAAVTPTSTTAAIGLIGVTASDVQLI